MTYLITQVFGALTAAGVRHALYKSLNNLKDDLAGKRGDLDVVIAREDLAKAQTTLRAAGMVGDRESRRPQYWFGLDPHAHTTVMLDVADTIPFGPKPYKPFELDVVFDQLQTELREGVRVVADADYVPLMALLRVMSVSEKQEDLEDLQTLLKTYGEGESFVRNIIEREYGVAWSEFARALATARNWHEVKAVYQPKLRKHLRVARVRWACYRLQGILRYMTGFKRKVLKRPRYRVRAKGFLVAFVGVDGAGKSSSVDYLCGLDYFKRTGIKSMYFGNNHYWMPGLTKLMARKNVNEPVVLTRIKGILSRIDRQMRIVGAMYYMAAGNIVIADRYFYDDFIGLGLQERKPAGPMMRMLKGCVAVKMWRKPDVTIFMDASPEVAYARKQDYSFEKMQRMNKAYKDYMYAQPGVRVVNTDNPQDAVWREVVAIVHELDVRRG